MKTILLATFMTLINFNEFGMLAFGLWWGTGAICMRYPPARSFLIAFYIVGGFWYGLAGAWG
jgi:hypothetical protein